MNSSLLAICSQLCLLASETVWRVVARNWPVKGEQKATANGLPALACCLPLLPTTWCDLRATIFRRLSAADTLGRIVRGRQSSRNTHSLWSSMEFPHAGGIFSLSAIALLHCCSIAVLHDLRPSATRTELEPSTLRAPQLELGPSLSARITKGRLRNKCQSPPSEPSLRHCLAHCSNCI